jgi:hypothetical protein
MGIRQNIARLVLKKNATKITRKPAFINLKKAQNMGILISDAEAQYLETIISFANELLGNGKKIYIVYFSDKTQLPTQYIENNSLNVLTKKDINLVMRPKTEFYEHFISKDMDILINFCFSESLPIEYFGQLSQAKLKISPSCTNWPYDFVLEVPEKDKLLLTKHIKDYLIEINNN